MKAMMRVDKTQVGPTLIRYTTPGGFTFDPMPYLAAGYKRFDALVIGASGGKSGSGSSGGLLVTNGKSGAGGGGSLVLSALLSEFAERWAITVGAPGGNAGAGGDGGAGGDSYLRNYWAGGGGGGRCARYISGGAGSSSYTQHNPAPKGGDGGRNWSNIGSGGTGGTAATYQRVVDGDGQLAPAVAAVNANYTAAPGGNYPAVGGSFGGGGGYPRTDGFNSLAGTGGSSAMAGAGYGSGGEGYNGIDGGNGGGCNAAPLTGVNEWYGMSAAGTNPQGAVFIKIT